MNHSTPWLTQLRHHRVIAVIRSDQYQLAWEMAQAVIEGGIQFIEITWNTDQAPRLIERLVSQFPRQSIGAGTLLTPNHLQTAIGAGAQFLFTPHTDLTLIALAQAQGIPIIPGALTPTEIITAWGAGATCVKVFPITAVGGASYLNSLKGPLGHIPLIPTGGVTLKNIRSLLQAGAIAVGLAGDLFPPPLIQAQNWPGITQQAQQLLQEIKGN